MRAALLVFVLAACGGKTAAPKGPAATDAEQTLVANAEAMQARVCACTDATCLSAVTDEEWSAAYQTPPADPAITDDGAARFTRAYLGAQRCIEAVYGPDAEGDATAAVAGVRELADRACECQDEACASRVRADFAVHGERHAQTSADDADIERYTEEHRRMSQCLRAWPVSSGIQACDDYVATMYRYLDCEKIPQATRDAAREGIEAMEGGWGDVAALPEEVRKQAEDGCRQALDALTEGATALGCSL